MKTILISGVTAAALAIVAVLVSEPPKRTATEGGPYRATPHTATQPAPQLIEERIFELPEDNLIWYTTVIYPANREADPASRRVAAWFATEPRLASLREQTRYKEVTPDNQLYAAHVHGQGELPIIWLQRGKTGERIYKADGDNLPKNGKALADEIATMIEQKCPCKPRPKPNQPQPKPQPPPDLPGPDDIEPIPDLRPVDEPEADDGPIELPQWSYGLFPLVAILAALAVGAVWKR